MKIFTTALAAMTLACAAQAQTVPSMTSYPVLCVDAESLGKTMQEFRELPFARGLSNSLANPDGPPTSLVIFVNPETKTWTIVERAAADRFCIMAVGNGFEPVPQDIRDRAEQEQNSGRL